MKKEYTAKYKSKCLAIRIVKLCGYLREEKSEFILYKQLLRSGTSIGANLAECEGGQSKRDFLAKVYIALKECNETLYWLDLLHDTEYLTDDEHASIAQDALTLKRMLTATTKTLKKQIEADL